MSLTLHGIGVSKGIAIGKVYILEHESIEITEYCVPKPHIDLEIKRFQQALDLARKQLQKIRDHTPKPQTVDIAAFIEAHIMMLEDSMLSTAPIELIKEFQCNAEWALQKQCDSVVQVFAEMEDPYLSARKIDVQQVVARVQRILRGYTDTPVEMASEHFANAIVVAEDLSPADTVLMQHYGILAFITEYGGATSHTAILARSLGIPAIVGLPRACSYIQPHDQLVIDGSLGVVVVTPSEEISGYYRLRQREQKRQKAALSKLKSSPVMTLDGTPITLHVNIEFPEDMEAVNRVGGEGIGLYRTEFLFMNRDQPPTEEEHLDAYLRVIKALKGGPVTIRTFDLGADKPIGKKHEGPLATNPALSLRAIRLCLKELKLFKPQLRAILRASAHGQVRLLIPMVSGLQEILQVRKLITEIQEELKQRSLPFNPNLPIGIMVEVPAIAVCTDLFAPQVDFLSIGTNDLIQYTLALDRVDGTVNYLYDPLHPAVLRLIKMSVEGAHHANKPISLCGEMASDSRYVRLLLGLGLRAFSVHPQAFLEIKKTINTSDLTGLSELTNKLLKTVSATEVLSLMETINA